MRFQRNNGSRGAAEWQCLSEDQKTVFCYARVVLVKDVSFVNNSADGWALGDPKWIAGVEKSPLIWPPEIGSLVRPDALARMPVEGWLPLWYRTGSGFWCYKRRLAGARWLLLGPGLAAIRRPAFAPDTPS